MNKATRARSKVAARRGERRTGGLLTCPMISRMSPVASGISRSLAREKLASESARLRPAPAGLKSGSLQAKLPGLASLYCTTPTTTYAASATQTALYTWGGG